MNKPLFHITFNEDWQKAASEGKYTPVEYFSDGFVLACYQEQLTTFANFLFHDYKKLLVLEIDPALLGCEVSEELSAGGSQMVPRIHGAIPVGAVVRTSYLERKDGEDFGGGTTHQNAAQAATDNSIPWYKRFLP
ncbi:MAG TPA: DUF952 domain-containing protein [Pseudomonadales bacterium]|nr:DUF952 domain-containing protein [Pseudomonadales bacterium]